MILEMEQKLGYDMHCKDFDTIVEPGEDRVQDEPASPLIKIQRFRF